MLIDWFTVGAQALNFLILVWLMKRFLYQPILDAIDAREKRIAAELADADAKKAEAQAERDTYQRKNEAFDQERSSLLIKATDDAATERKRLFEDARTAAAAMNAKRQETLSSEAATLALSIRRRTQEEVFAIARKTLADLASTSLDERVAEVFIQRLRALTGEVRSGLGDALKSALGDADEAVVRSAFELPPTQRDAIVRALDETFSAPIRVRFETAPDLVNGIQLNAAGQALSWNIDNYLASMEKSVGELLTQPPKVAPSVVEREEPSALPQAA
jgi:F-type H+-transporting ATPase subunit b